MNVSEKVVEKKNMESQRKNMDTIAKLIVEKLNGLNIELSEISELSNLVKEVVELNVKIQKLSEERLQKLNRAKEIYEKLDSNAAKILEFLGLLDTQQIERVIGKARERTTERAERGNGLSGKKIVFQGKQYNISSYFLKKFGISGGLKGLEQWAKSQGRSVKIENDVIYIL